MLWILTQSNVDDLVHRRRSRGQVMDGCAPPPSFWCLTLMLPQRKILLFNISINSKYLHFKLFHDSNYLNSVHKLKHKHKLKYYLLRLVAVPTSALIWSAEDNSTHWTVSRTVCNHNIYCDHHPECTKFLYFSRKKFTSIPSRGKRTPHTLPHRALWPLSTLRRQVWSSSYAYDLVTGS